MRSNDETVGLDEDVIILAGYKDVAVLSCSVHFGHRRGSKVGHAGSLTVSLIVLIDNDKE